MATHRYDLYQVLSFTRREDGSVNCVGKNWDGDRCGWRFFYNSAAYRNIRNLLDEMDRQNLCISQQSLYRLAELSLCKEGNGFKGHQDQIHAVVARWTQAILKASESFKQLEQRRNYELDDHLANEKAEAGNFGREAELLPNAVAIYGEPLEEMKAEMGRPVKDHAVEIKRLVADNEDLKSQLIKVREQLSQRDEELVNVKKELKILGTQDDSLTAKLDSEARTYDTYRSDLARLQRRELIDKMTLYRRNAAECEKDLKECKTTLATVSKGKAVVEAELENERQKNKYLTAQLRKELSTTQEELSATKLELGESQTRLDICQKDFDELRATNAEKETKLSATIEELTGQIDRVNKTSAEQLQNWRATKDKLSDAKLALKECQLRVENYQRELKTAAGEREVLSASHAALTDRIDFSKRHPFKAFSKNLGSAWKQWIKVFGSGEKKMSGRNRVIVDPEEGKRVQNQFA